MADPDAAWNRQPATKGGRLRRLGAALPMRTALLAVASVWAMGCVWSYHEQSAFAASKGFGFPHLLPLVIDGFAVSMAGVAWAASLDARPAVPARLATLVAVAASSASNGVWAYLRANHDMVTVLLGVAVPIAANLAFEVLLAELRRQVQRRRGLPPPVAVPYPRLIRLALAPWQTFRAWRKMVLEITAMEHQLARPPGTAADQAPTVTATASVSPATDPAAATRGAERSEAAIAAPKRALSTPAQPALATAATPTRRSPATSVAAGRPDRAVSALDTAATQAMPTVPAAAPVQPRGVVSATAHANGAAVRNAAVATNGSQLDAGPSAANGPAANGPAATNGPAAAQGTPTRVSSAGAVPTRPHTVEAAGNGNGSERPIDPRVEQLAQHLANSDEPDDLTGEMVGPLLNIDVAPRTGRRLLGQARELLNRRAQAEAEAQGRDPRLSVIGGR